MKSAMQDLIIIVARKRPENSEQGAAEKLSHLPDV